ncbi:MAG: hypothetical protein JWO93_2737 [Micrococcaceae bacterium]|nr:hypothetical protein [Micrococcaceae bacterium]
MACRFGRGMDQVQPSSGRSVAAQDVQEAKVCQVIESPNPLLLVLVGRLEVTHGVAELGQGAQARASSNSLRAATDVRARRVSSGYSPLSAVAAGK